MEKSMENEMEARGGLGLGGWGAGAVRFCKASFHGGRKSHVWQTQVSDFSAKTLGFRAWGLRFGGVSYRAYGKRPCDFGCSLTCAFGRGMREWKLLCRNKDQAVLTQI